MKGFDPSAIGSDIPRTRTQYLVRKVAAFVVAVLRLNRPTLLSTEIVQQIYPICTIPTKFGSIRCKGGHGRLRWRALTFYTEEPETIKWLDSMTSEDIFWDVGANVGLYSIYSAMSAGCKVLAIEPEAQNFALLLENILMNGVQGNVEATNLAITDSFGLGRLDVHALTKGGAYNTFSLGANMTTSIDSNSFTKPVSQMQIGASLDYMVNEYGFPNPTYVKIDVDGNEPEIISGASEVLSHPACKSVLIEIQKNDPEHVVMLDQMTNYGYQCVSERSNWDSRSNRIREDERPATNMIFVKV